MTWRQRRTPVFSLKPVSLLVPPRRDVNCYFIFATTVLTSTDTPSNAVPHTMSCTVDRADYKTHRSGSFDLQFGWNFIFKMTAIEVHVPREPLWIVMLWSQQRAPCTQT